MIDFTFFRVYGISLWASYLYLVLITGLLGDFPMMWNYVARSVMLAILLEKKQK